MANTTLKFGNGEWYGKEDTILAYNDLNSNYKPLPFNFERGSTATRINKEGLIETVGANEPRIDYKDDSKGALLLEPSRTNSITYSEDFSTGFGWLQSGIATVTSGYLSPDGSLNAYKLSNANGTVRTGNVIVRNFGAGNYTFSLYVKSLGSTKIKFYFRDGSTGNIVDSGSLSLTSEYKRLTFSHNVINTSNFYIGDTDGDVIIYGAQLEQGSYPTSYIPTQGTAQTRLADSCSQTVPDGVIGQTEGTIFFDGYYGDEPAEVYLFLQENLGTGVSNSIYIQKFGINSISMQVYDGNNFQTQLSGGSYVSGQKIKIAVAYKQNDFALYINSIQIGVSSGGLVPSLKGIQIGTYPALSDTSNYIASKGINDVKLYNTRLSNSELQALTQV